MAKTSRKTIQGKARARIVSIKRHSYTGDYESLIKAAITSNQITDPFNADYGAAKGQHGKIIEPIFPFPSLMRIYSESNILRSCIESYVVNIESYGHILEYVGPEGSEDEDDVQTEKQTLLNFLSNPGFEDSLIESRKKSRIDQEVVGGRAFEIIRDNSGRIVVMNHIPADTIRLTKRDKEPTETKITFPDPTDPDRLISKTVNKFFRRLVQKGPTGKKVYFKEFGDPRSIDPKTGDADAGMTTEGQATEILYIAPYTPGSVYGTPRWIGQLPAILGSRESELVNLNFFRDNAIPAMAVLVSGGALTEDSFNTIERYITAVKGQDAMQRVLILEAAADDMSGSVDHSQPAPRIEMKPMISERQQEGLFQDYDQKNQQKVRSAFRLPPIYVGRAEDYTRASAFASMLVAENQVFQPERDEFDQIMNERILSTYKPKYWHFKSLGPAVAEPEAVSKMIKEFGAQGALTPNAVIKIANQMLDVHIEPVKDAWGDYPFNIIMQYVKAGAIIGGMEEFIENIEDLKAAPDNPDLLEISDEPEEVVEAFRGMLDSISKDIRRSRRTKVYRRIRTDKYGVSAKSKKRHKVRRLQTSARKKK